MKLKKLITSVVFLLPMVMYAQDTIYMDKNHEKTKLKNLALTYQLTRTDRAVNEGKIETEYYLSGKVKSECHLVAELTEKSKKKKDVWEGTFKMWYESGQLKRDIDYHLNKIDGHLTTYWENGKVKRQDLYQEDKVVEGKCFDENGHETAYYPFHKMPQYPGGEKGLMCFISMNLKYPVNAQEAGIQGKVVAHFVIDTSGQVSDIQIIRRLYPSMDNEALRVISILKHWIPAEVDGEKENQWYTLPIQYRLE